MWSQEGQWEPEARRMEPLSRQEKLSTSLARLNGNTAGQEGERPPGCRHGGPAGLPSVASVCWRFRESSDLRGDCVFPWRGLSWGAGPRMPAACEVVSVYLSLGCLGPTQSSPPDRASDGSEAATKETGIEGVWP